MRLGHIEELRRAVWQLEGDVERAQCPVCDTGDGPECLCWYIENMELKLEDLRAQLALLEEE